MRYYEQGRAVPQEAQKSFNNGSFSGTDINPMWRIKKLTEFFGPCGLGWYYEVLSERAETYGGTVMAIVDLNLYIKEGGEWSKPIFGTGGNLLVQETKSGLRPSDEGYKKALTDALSVACKALGIGADVYFDKDTTKYTSAQKPAEAPIPMQKPSAGLQEPTQEEPTQFIPATQAQINTLRARLQPVQLAAMRQKFGDNLERLSKAKAGEALNKVMQEAGR
jgi:hypothetical protein